jgi:hypothetical protein
VLPLAHTAVIGQIGWPERFWPLRRLISQTSSGPQASGSGVP